MALSGTLSGSYEGWTYRIDWSATQSVANNTSTITCKHYLVCKKAYDLYVGSRSNTCTVDGVSQSFTSPSISTAGNQTISLGTTTHTVTHNSDGSKSCAVNSYFYVKATLAGTYKSYFSVSGTIVLDTIQRAVQPTIAWRDSTQYFGDRLRVILDNASGFTYKVHYKFGVQEGTISTNAVATVDWTVPVSLMNLIPNATKGSGTIYVDTYSGSTLVGTKYSGFTAYVPPTVIPSCTCTLEDVTGADDSWGSPVQGVSRIKVVVSATGVYSSPIKSYSVSIDGKTYSSATVTTGVLTKSGTSPVNVTVTDGRGCSGTWSYDMTVKAYSKPSISKLTVHRCDKNGTENDKGDYVKVTFSTSSDEQGTVEHLLYRKQTSATSWSTLGVDVNGNSPLLTDIFSVENESFIYECDGSYAWDFKLTMVDEFHTVSKTTSVSTAFTLMNFHKSGKGLRFGGVAEENESEIFRNDLELKQTANRYCFSSPGTAGSSGYVRMAQLTHTKANADTPITFVFTQRLASSPMTVYVQFRSDSTTDDPDLKSITYEGSNYGAFLVRSAESVWDLYVQKVSAFDTITLQDWYSSGTVSDRLTVTFPGDLVSAVPEGLDGYYRATPTVPRSILDCFMPVGYVLTLYDNHLENGAKMNPNVMYPGTTWERIENRFLWATTEGGTIGQTGGESTHTLTVNEMPSHRHTFTGQDGFTNSKTNSINKSGSAYSSLPGFYKGADYGSSGSVSLDYTGGGAAHNNMPPYIQVSIWRRTG